jgi:hypothetical protein
MTPATLRNSSRLSDQEPEVPLREITDARRDLDEVGIQIFQVLAVGFQ